MKKLILTLSLGALLTAGFLFADEPTELASDAHPSVLSIGNTISL
ncbi:hypothetical protein GCM10009001_13580 [Virgibacillus siamensis]|uniref:Phosphatase n=1 Tax=Virgibacillus siamensis TaxID=480071 RepID=A0ABN1FVG0_9BACI